tara:strand:- start:272 stop:664 length:393 start_codon:yes stop_codon:yes gene_type:complete
MYIKTISSKQMNINRLLPQLYIKDWGDVSPIEVIKDKNISINDYKRIINSDLRYPIIITKNNKVIDGMHRLSKAYLLNKKNIRAYILNDKIMKKFIITKKIGKNWKKTDWNYYESLTKKDIEILYKERFL